MEKELIVAAENGYKLHVESILSRPQMPDLANLFYTSPLIRACRNGHLEVARVLLEAEADPSGPRGSAAGLPLIEACTGGHLEVARLLLDSGADKNKVGICSPRTGGRMTPPRPTTPLQAALMQGHVEMVRLLLEPDFADVDKILEIERAGETPLCAACSRGQVEMVRMLLAVGADSDKVSRGVTPIGSASIKGQFAIVRLLLEAQAVTRLLFKHGFKSSSANGCVTSRGTQRQRDRQAARQTDGQIDR